MTIKHINKFYLAILKWLPALTWQFRDKIKKHQHWVLASPSNKMPSNIFLSPHVLGYHCICSMLAFCSIFFFFFFYRFFYILKFSLCRTDARILVAFSIANILRWSRREVLGSRIDLEMSYSTFISNALKAICCKYFACTCVL